LLVRTEGNRSVSREVGEAPAPTTQTTCVVVRRPSCSAQQRRGA
jgi:hypothetical protein